MATDFSGVRSQHALMAGGNYLRAWREYRGLSQDRVADQLGTDKSQISKLEGGKRRVTVEWMRRLAPIYGLAEWAELAKPPPERGRAVSKSTPRDTTEFAGEPYAAVPTFDLRISAGHGATNDHEDIEGYALYRRDWLSMLTRSPVSRLAVFRVSGDSMWDTMHDGDQVLVDRTVQQPGRDGVYVIRLGDEFQVKRVSLHPSSKLLTIKSDNPAYPSYSDIPPAEIAVIGRVIWIGRNIG